MHLLIEFNKMSTLWECSGVRCVGACGWIWKHKITLHITGSGVRHIETATLSHETSLFFGPFPRKQRLTVYRGIQVYVVFGSLFDDISGLMYSFGLSSFVNLDMGSLLPWIAAGTSRKSI